MLGNWLVRGVSEESDRRGRGGGRSLGEKQEGRQEEGGREGGRRRELLMTGGRRQLGGGGSDGWEGRRQGRVGL